MPESNLSRLNSLKKYEKMNEQEKIEVLEEIFFQTQPEFGQRIIKKGVGRIDLETTHDGGRSWRVTLHDYFTGTIIE